MCKSVGLEYSVLPPDTITFLTTFSTDVRGEFGGKVDVGLLTEQESTVDLWHAAKLWTGPCCYVPDKERQLCCILSPRSRSGVA